MSPSIGTTPQERLVRRGVAAPAPGAPPAVGGLQVAQVEGLCVVGQPAFVLQHGAPSLLVHVNMWVVTYMWVVSWSHTCGWSVGHIQHNYMAVGGHTHVGGQ